MICEETPYNSEIHFFPRSLLHLAKMGAGRKRRKKTMAATIFAAAFAALLPATTTAQTLTPPYFNIAENRKVVAKFIQLRQD